MSPIRLLIVGAAGMLGHKMWQELEGRFETWGTIRASYDTYAHLSLYNRTRIIDNLDVTRHAEVERTLQEIRPDVVVNCVGLVKQLTSICDIADMIELNALFPHQLARMCKTSGVRLIHIGTDCVFSGRRSMYTESSTPDPTDLYGRSKHLGEVSGGSCLTLRTSLIGRELCSCHGLVEWFLSNRGGEVSGFEHAVFSGVTTMALSRIVGNVVEKHAALSGIYHVSAAAIDKLTLLGMLRDAFRIEIRIKPDPKLQINRSLDDHRFRQATGLIPDSWADMIEELGCDPTPYEEWRSAV